MGAASSKLQIALGHLYIRILKKGYPQALSSKDKFENFIINEFKNS